MKQKKIKLKTKKGALKRFNKKKLNSFTTFSYFKGGHKHNLSNKTRNYKRKLKHLKFVNNHFNKKFQRLLPY